MNTEIVVAVKAIIEYRNQYLIIKRDENDEIGAGTWEFLGGKAEFGEDLECVLIRESNEETGLNIAIDKLLYATSFLSNPCRQVIILAYKCHASYDDVTLSFEHTNYLWASISQLRENLDIEIVKSIEKYHVFDILQ